MEHEQQNKDKDHEQIFSLMLADDYDPSLLTLTWGFSGKYGPRILVAWFLHETTWYV